MPEREQVEGTSVRHRRAPSPGTAPPVAGGAAAPAARALQRQVGNRAMARMLSRMEAPEAVEALEGSLGAGVMGAERRVVDTLTAFSADTAGFDQVAKDYEQKAKAPLVPAVDPVPGAAGLIPKGWYPGISE